MKRPFVDDGHSSPKVKRTASSPKILSGTFAQDLDDIPHLMNGAFWSFLKAIWQSLQIILPLVFSCQVALISIIVIVVIIGSWLLLRRFLLLVEVLPTLVVALFGLVFLAECIFFWYLRGVRDRLQATTHVDGRPPAPSGPLDVYSRTMERVEKCAAWQCAGCVGRSSTEWLEGWFCGTPFEELKRENIVEFYAWAFWTKKPNELKADERRMVAEMIDDGARRYAWNLPDGYNPDARPIRINFDPLLSWCHPLSYYAVIRSFVALARQAMRALGFSYHPASTTGGLAFFHKAPPRKPAGTLIVDGAAVDPPAELPIVLIHGVGVGPGPYLRLIRRLAYNRECFVVELPEVSQIGVESVLSPTAMAEALEEMLASKGHRSACFVAHSYGTFILSWVARERPSIVAKGVFLDPVCFLLSQPDVAFNFLYRKPDNPFLQFVTHFVRWELFSANVLMRNFYWYHNVLWDDEIPQKCVVALSSADDITHAALVKSYLEDYQRRHVGSDRRLDLLWFEGFFHGGILLSKSAQMQVMEHL